MRPWDFLMVGVDADFKNLTGPALNKRMYSQKSDGRSILKKFIGKNSYFLKLSYASSYCFFNSLSFKGSHQIKKIRKFPIFVSLLLLVLLFWSYGLENCCQYLSVDTHIPYTNVCHLSLLTSEIFHFTCMSAMTYVELNMLV